MVRGKVKYRAIFEELQKEIRNGRFPQGVPLPSEEALGRKHGVSRITVVRAMDELVRKGLVYRKRGAGTFATRTACSESGRIGLIMPSLSFGEIFPPICQALTRCAQQDGYSIVLGDISSPHPDRRAHEACKIARAFVKQRVAGVLFQPLAFLKTPERVTCEILALFRDAGIPVVLLDRDVEHSVVPHDFVGIDNLGAGRAIGAHLLARKAKRVVFLSRPNCASVIRDRIDGVASALSGSRARFEAVSADPSDTARLAKLFRGRARPDAVVCESDYVAARLRNTRMRLKLSVPKDVMLAGFDDLMCAVTATPPLTTAHQPCADLASVAYRALRERMRDPSLSSRKLLLPAPLVVRESTRKS